jgi:hypothetical protein
MPGKVQMAQEKTRREKEEDEAFRNKVLAIQQRRRELGLEDPQRGF